MMMINDDTTFLNTVILLFHGISTILMLWLEKKRYNVCVEKLFSGKKI